MLRRILSFDTDKLIREARAIIIIIIIVVINVIIIIIWLGFVI